MAHVLIADDDRMERTFVGRVMQAGGHTWELAWDGEVALRRFREESFDLVITDLAMPRLNGLRLIQELVEIDAGVRIIAVSGLNSDQLLIAEDYGANALLQKPWKAREMLDTIEQVLREEPTRSSGWGKNRQKAEAGLDDLWY